MWKNCTLKKKTKKSKKSWLYCAKKSSYLSLNILISYFQSLFFNLLKFFILPAEDDTVRMAVLVDGRTLAIADGKNRYRAKRRAVDLAYHRLMMEKKNQITG